MLLCFLRIWQEEAEQMPMKRPHHPHKTAGLYKVSFVFTNPTVSAQQLQYNPAVTSQGIFMLLLLFASWKWLENRRDWGITAPVFGHYKGRKNGLRAGSSSVMWVSGGSWNKLQPSLVMCKWQCQVRNARLASTFRRCPCWGISTGHLHSGMLLQLSSNKVLSPWTREDSPSYHLATVPLTDAGATWTGSDKSCQPKDLRKWDWIQ